MTLLGSGAYAALRTRACPITHTPGTGAMVVPVLRFSLPDFFFFSLSKQVQAQNTQIGTQHAATKAMMPNTSKNTVSLVLPGLGGMTGGVAGGSGGEGGCGDAGGGGGKDGGGGG